MSDHEGAVREEIVATIRRANFEAISFEDIAIDITESFGRRLGECRRVSAGETTSPSFEIRLAKRLFTDRDDDQWQDTVRHELAHAVVIDRFGSDVAPHGKEWKEAARRAGANPRARYEGRDESVDPNYLLACPEGCTEWEYLNRSKRIKNPWLYSCPECETQLISYDAGDRPSNPDAGTCYVSSIPWEQPRYVQACPNDCFSAGYGDQPAEIQTPSEYTCSACGAKTIAYPVGNRPADPAPGSEYVQSQSEGAKID